jgi:uncharacterized membrane protein YedE/YeeE
VFEYGPLWALSGGALIGLAASLLFWFNGRIAGISGIVAGLLLPARGESGWRAAFLAGLGLAGALALLLAPEAIGRSPYGLPVLALGGLLVGLGTRLGDGCTSGHGVCGVSRLSARSIVATGTFIATGVVTVLSVRLLGGAP